MNPKKKMAGRSFIWLMNVLYFLCLATVWFLLMFEIYLCYQKYERWPTYQNKSNVDQKHAPLPDITICAGDNMGLKKDVLEVHGLTLDFYTGGRGGRFRKNTSWTSKSGNPITPEKLFEDATYTLEDLVEVIMIETLEKSGGKPFLPVLESNPYRLNTSLVDVIVKTEIMQGKCYTMRLTGLVKKYGVFTISILRKNPIKIFVHTIDMFNDLNTRRDVSVIDKSLDYFVEYKVNYEMQKGHGGNFSCENYNYDNVCWYDKYDKVIRAATTDNCTIPWAQNNTNICTTRQNIETALGLIGNIVQERIYCPKTCLTMPLLLTGGVVEKPGPKVGLVLRFQPWIPVSHEEDLYTALSLIAEVGGYVGILCGYSILTLVQWLYQVTWSRLQK